MFAPDLLHQVEPGNIRQQQVKHESIEVLFAQFTERFGAGTDGNKMGGAIADQRFDALSLRIVVLNHQEIACGMLETFQASNQLLELFARDRFFAEAYGAMLESCLLYTSDAADERS